LIGLLGFLSTTNDNIALNLVARLPTEL